MAITRRRNITCNMNRLYARRMGNMILLAWLRERVYELEGVIRWVWPFRRMGCDDRD